MTTGNIDQRTVRGFGDQWGRFDQRHVTPEKIAEYFDSYFRVFPWDSLPANAVGFDLGCGTGRWAAVMAKRVGTLHCVDPADGALAVCREKLKDARNVHFHHASVDAIPLAEGTMDFGYSLGVLHHVPDTAAGIAACVRLLKPGAPFLVYLYYRFDNKPAWFRRVWQVSELGRAVISRLPMGPRYVASQALAAGIYLPLARTARALERRGFDVENMPLSTYRDRSFYTMRTDALDRLGTRLEQRFTRDEMRDMMTRAGLERISFSDQVPYWCAVGYRR